MGVHTYFAFLEDLISACGFMAKACFRSAVCEKQIDLISITDDLSSDDFEVYYGRYVAVEWYAKTVCGLMYGW